MSALFLVLIVIIFIHSCAGLLHIFTTWKFIKSYGNEKKTTWKESKLPFVSLIVPCKGDDGSLFKSLESIVNQEYPRVEYIFSTASSEDEAQKVFLKLKEKYPNKQLKTIVAGMPDSTSQKCNNQLKALRSIEPECSILIFMDSDTQYRSTFIRKLIDPLAEDNIHVSTGYRWYIPRLNKLGDLFRSTWNAASVFTIANPKTRFLWGGGFAIKRTLFDKLKLIEIFSNSLCEDMPLSSSLKKMGLEIHFAPECIELSKEEDTLFSAIKWTSGQLQLTWFYNKALWALVALSHGLGNLMATFAWIFALYSLLISKNYIEFYFSLSIALYSAIFILIYGLLSMRVLEKIIVFSNIELGKEKYFFPFLTYLVSFCQGLGSFLVIFKKRFAWSGIMYEVRAKRTKILSGE